MTATLYTVGHSTHSLDAFVGLLRGAGVTAVADVRSAPYSRHMPWFSKDALREGLAAAGVGYFFLGNGLGARPKDRACYRDGVARYNLIAATAAFDEAIAKLLRGAGQHRIALMCAEKEPLDCHRTLLVGRHLVAAGATLNHILADGRIEPHAETERRLLELTGQRTLDMFAPGDSLARAYDIRGGQIAYTEAAEAPTLQAAE